MPYRSINQLTKLAEMLAILIGDTEVTQEHIDQLITLLSYLNYDFNAV